MTATVAEAQARLPDLLARLIPGEELLLTEDGRVVARLVAEPPPPKERKFGSMAGSVLYMAPDFDAPLDDFKDYM